MFLFTRAFWKYAGERAIKTFAQTTLAGLTVGGIAGILDVAWVPLASVSGLATLASLLTAIIAYSPAAEPAPKRVYTLKDSENHLGD